MKLWAILPELVLGGACLVLVPLAGLLRGRWRRLVPALAAVALAVAMALTARMLPWAPVGAFDGLYAVDGFAHVFKLLIEAAALITLALLTAYVGDHEQLASAPVALVFSSLGAMLLTSSLDLALIVLFLQMMSMATYLLVALMRSDRRAHEATLKLFLFGAVALAVMAYGLTFVYGLTGSLEPGVIGPALADGDRPWLLLAFLLVLVGYGFEITLVPFHFWSPDVFGGATAPVAGFLSVVPKIGATAALLRFVVYALPGERVGWPSILAAAAAVTMTFGNLVALRQTRLKRLLAYSSIAQAGYVLMGVAVATRASAAVPAVAYYLGAYVFMNLGAFAVVAQLERTSGTDSFPAIAGLGRRSPFAAAVLTFSLLSLAGIPPLAGFAGKVLLLRATLAGGMFWLALVAAANWVLALVVYVRIIAELYLKPAGVQAPLATGPAYRVVHAVNLAGMIGLGVFAGPALELIGLSSLWLR